MALNLCFILTRSPHEGDTDSLILNTAFQGLGKGDRVTIFLLGDSVWLANKNKSKLEGFIQKGGSVAASGEHLQAHGLSRDDILPSVGIATDTYDQLVDLVMEKCDKVVII